MASIVTFSDGFSCAEECMIRFLIILPSCSVFEPMPLEGKEARQYGKRGKGKVIILDFEMKNQTPVQ